MRRFYVERVWDDSMGIYSRAERGGDRLIARGMSRATAEKIARLLNEDDRRSVDPRAVASSLTRYTPAVPCGQPLGRHAGNGSSAPPRDIEAPRHPGRSVR